MQYAPKELLTVMGVEGDPNNIPGALRLDEGRWPRRTDEIMLGAKLAREKELRVGDTVPVGAVVASRVTFVE